MTEAMRREPGLSGLSLILSVWRDPAAWILLLDLATVLIAVLLPWSTTGVVIASVLWLIVLAPTIEPAAFLRSLNRPICILPIAMLTLASVGMLWSDAPWGERFHAVGPTLRLLMLPLLLYHWERSPRGKWVFIGFLILVPAADGGFLGGRFRPQPFAQALFFARGLSAGQRDPGQELHRPKPGIHAVRGGARLSRHGVAANQQDLAGSAAHGDRRELSGQHDVRGHLAHGAGDDADHACGVRAAASALRMAIVALCAAVVLAALVWNVSPHLRGTVGKFYADYQESNSYGNISGMGSRLEFWKKSLRFFADAPVIGHGTGSTRGLFEQAAVGQVGVRAEITSNPHNQTLNVAVQWGVIGVVLLYAMWLVHLLLFRGDSLAAWIGLLVVVQNVSTSLFNSHLFDFQEAWMYVLGVGVAGGMVLRAKAG